MYVVGVFRQNRPAQPVLEEVRVGEVGEEFLARRRAGRAKGPGQVGGPYKGGSRAWPRSSLSLLSWGPVSGVHLSCRGLRGPPSSLNCLGHKAKCLSFLG